MKSNDYEYLLAEIEQLNEAVEEIQAQIAYIKDKLLEK